LIDNKITFLFGGQMETYVIYDPLDQTYYSDDGWVDDPEEAKFFDRMNADKEVKSFPFYWEYQLKKIKITATILEEYFIAR